MGENACAASQQEARQRSRSPVREQIGQSRSPNADSRRQPFLCIVLGGPGCGKTSLGARLQQLFPSIYHVSGGDIARVATSDKSRESPLLNSISRQLSDSRRRKTAIRRLAEFVNAVLVEAFQSYPEIRGLIVDGVRVGDFSSLEAQSTSISCVLRLECSRDTMLSRIRGRTGREGDVRLGLADGDEGINGELFNAFQTVDRVDAFLERYGADDEALRAHFAGDAYGRVVHGIDAEAPADTCAQTAAKAVREAISRTTPDILTESTAGLQCTIDWAALVEATAKRLDLTLHPDGRPRVKAA